MANKTVSAVVSLLDKFSDPSKKVSEASKNMERRFKEVGKTVGNVGQVLTGAGTAMTKYITGPIMAVGTASVAAYKEVDNALDIITKKTGATGDQMKEFETVFRNVAGTVPASMDDVGTAVGEVNTRLGLTGKELEDASVAFLQFAELNGTDVNTAIDMVSAAMNNAGIAAEDYATVLDQMNVAGQMSGVSMDSLAGALTKYGASMRQMGFDTSDTIAMYAGWEKAGINTEKAFTGMQKASAKWAKEGKNSREEFAKTIEAIENASSSTEAAQIAIDTFGTKAGPDLADAVRTGRFSVEDYTKAIEGAGGSVADTYAGTQDAFDKLNTIVNTVKTTLSDLGATIAEAALPFIESLSEKVKAASEWFHNLSPETKENIVKFAGLAAAIGPALLAVGGIVKKVGGAVEAFGQIKSAVEKAGGVFSLFKNPVFIIIGLIAAAAAAFIAASGGIDGAMENIKKFWENTLKPAFDQIIEWVREKIVPVFEENWPKIQQAAESVITALGDIIESVWVPAFEGAVDFVTGTLVPAFVDNWPKVQDAVGVVISAISVAWETILKPAFQAIGSFVLDTLVPAFVDNWPKIQSAVDLAISGISVLWETILQPAFKAIGEFITGTLAPAFEENWPKIQGAVETAFDAISSAWEFLRTNVFAPISSAVNAVRDTFSEAWPTISGAVDTAFGAIESVWNTIVEAVFVPIANTVNQVRDTFSNVFNSESGIGKFVSDVVSDISGFIEEAKSVIEGITSWLNDTFIAPWGAAWDSISGKVSGAFSGIADAIKSPLNTAIGWINGFIDKVNSFGFDLPGVMGGGHIGFDIKHIPTLAKGTQDWKGGIAQISEKGGEIVDLPKHTRVYPHDKSVQMAKESGKSVSINIAKLAESIVVREDADIDRIAQALADKLERTALNMA